MFTEQEIKSLARKCLGAWGAGCMSHDRYYGVELAMSGMYAKLAESPDATEIELMNAGFNEARKEARALNLAHGRVAQGTHWSQRYHAYWIGNPEPLGDPESVVDRMATSEAFAAAWVHLSAVEKEAVIAKAKFDKPRRVGAGNVNDEAAASLGISTRLFRTRLQNARKAFRREWVAPCA